MGFVETYGNVQYPELSKLVRKGTLSKSTDFDACEIPECDWRQGERLVYDHCHLHGFVRGVICIPCNSRMIMTERRIIPESPMRLWEGLLNHWAKCPECPDQWTGQVEERERYK